ncbi:DUF2071 domain-containing protein [Euzebya tangerina]|uniref:DUF2071 domain-containing protein n=1 Tax=Euzebya tangerina TaxID=591198 RepID=UPI0013C31EAD|nr:DUF2071 domain-containing protein [Euzebya tangerina]
MTGRAAQSQRTVRGTIRRRLLVNALVDPDEAAERLPAGVRPHVTPEGTVVGCCMLEIEGIRPAGVPVALGQRLRAVAHRISVEWEDGSGGTEIGVYVPIRHTDSRLAAVLGGRWFPGVHERARIEVSSSGLELRWASEPLDATHFGMRAEVHDRADAAAGAACDPVGATCLGASVGLSPDRRGRLEAARMEPSHRDARLVTVDVLESNFIDSFSTAVISNSFLMCDADVEWTRAAAPAIVSGGTPARRS